MLGNVAAWTEDCYVDGYGETPTDGTPNTAGPCTSRVVRGGSWYFDLRLDRAANRNSNTPGGRLNILGFRLARTVLP
jgi:formylglycine-generating enzyme required for sulfatase activity